MASDAQGDCRDLSQASLSPGIGLPDNPQCPAGAVTSPLSLQPGARPIADYELIRPLGSGRFGEVWKARGPGGFHVALKFLRLGDQASTFERTSLRVMKDQRHPHLLALFGAWRHDDLLIMAMELGDRTLYNRLREAAKGIDHLNEMGIQHRDVKPQNLLLVGGGVKIADFGLAPLLERSLGTTSGALTPAYAAPECLSGQVSSQSDQYSLGVTYCKLRSGQLPFTGNPVRIVTGHLMQPPDLTMLPKEERPVLARALAKSPADRWPNCRAFTEALAEAQMGHARTPAAPGQKQGEVGARKATGEVKEEQTVSALGAPTEGAGDASRARGDRVDASAATVRGADGDRVPFATRKGWRG